MCNDNDQSKGDADMEKVSQNQDQKKVNVNKDMSLNEMLNKGMDQYDELLKKLSRN